ncbi:MAG: hypothetical protein FWF95_04185 [Syntrophorhabdaceae bacterium]|nr:hypothetical protein [Syntrophorhabdaceae bacterium]
MAAGAAGMAAGAAGMAAGAAGVAAGAAGSAAGAAGVAAGSAAETFAAGMIARVKRKIQKQTAYLRINSSGKERNQVVTEDEILSPCRAVRQKIRGHFAAQTSFSIFRFNPALLLEINAR